MAESDKRLAHAQEKLQSCAAAGLLESKETPYYLGIDIGTTTVKACILDRVGRPIGSKLLSYPQSIWCAAADGFSEQDPHAILDSVEQCVSSFSEEILTNLKRIGICGQMHGVCLWTYESRDLGHDPKRMSMSRHVTWMDQRCDPEFLTSLPVPESHLTLSTGHGCATLFWLQRNRPHEIAAHDSAGTIMDLLVAILCDLRRPIMSSQNAASWGYFDCSKNSFNLNILQDAAFPCHLLPEVISPGSKVMTLKSSWLGIRAGTCVDVALGDFQCSVFSAMSSVKPTGAETSRKIPRTLGFVNISTSAQIAFISDGNGFLETERKRNGVEYFPFFDDTFLAVGASLNGGNVLATFVQSIQNILALFGQTVEADEVWTKILDAGSAPDVASTTLKISPLLFGERHSPDARASVTNLSSGNQSVGDYTRALCRGLVQNLSQFISAQDFLDAGISNIIATGSAVLRNAILQEELISAFSPLGVHFTSSDFGAEFGVAAFSRILDEAV